MKAYCVFYQTPADGCLLVLAESANQARYTAANQSCWSDEWNYIDASAKREPKFDDISQGRSVFETNDDMPEGCEPFYLDFEDWG